ncbi:MAG: restriction endonuclease [Proteobacteria bacterium]|nr:restriction endonuclease [Pseudomonadota bacterium]
MELTFNKNLAENYTNNSQIARILTENWVKQNSYCPNCGEKELYDFENNRRVADFYCNKCSEEYELKSKQGVKVGKTIVDGAYTSMIDRITSDNNPNFFFLTYNKPRLVVNNYLIIPKQFFTSEIIIKRSPLSLNARRAGWIGCNIDLTNIPKSGRIYLVKNSKIISPSVVCSKWSNITFLKTKTGSSKGWILDIMNCIDKINNDVFSLKEIYSFENKLQEKHPNNNFIKDKIRQQLQILRNKGLIEFKNRGIYKKVKL